MPPPAPAAPWQLAQFAVKIADPCALSPALATVFAAGDAAIADVSELAAAAGAADAVAVLDDEESDDLAHPVAINPASEMAARNATVGAFMTLSFRDIIAEAIPNRHTPAQGVDDRLLKATGVTRISIRFAKPADAARLVTDGVLYGPLPAGESWSNRAAKWSVEQAAGRRAILIAQDATGLLGMVQIVFRFPPGYTDLEAANGSDIAMIETLRARPGVGQHVVDRLLSDAATVAKQHRVSTLTLCLPLESDRAILQAKAWGFSEFRLMPEPGKMLAFFRKPIA